MEKMELYDYYNLDECIDRKKIISTLKKLKKEGKIDYSLDGEVLRLEDIDLEEGEIEYLSELFDENDVFPNTDRDDEDDDYYSEEETEIESVANECNDWESDSEVDVYETTWKTPVYQYSGNDAWD